MAAFFELSFAVHWQEMLCRVSTTSNRCEVVNNGSDGGQSCQKSRLIGVVKYCLLTIGTVKAVHHTEYRGGREAGVSYKYYSE